MCSKCISLLWHNLIVVNALPFQMFHFVASMLLFSMFLGSLCVVLFGIFVSVSSDKQLTWIKSGFHSHSSGRCFIYILNTVAIAHRMRPHKHCENGNGGDSSSINSSTHTHTISLSLLLGKIIWHLFDGLAFSPFANVLLFLYCVKCCSNRIKTFQCASLLLLLARANFFLCVSHVFLFSLIFESTANVQLLSWHTCTFHYRDDDASRFCSFSLMSFHSFHFKVALTA